MAPLMALVVSSASLLVLAGAQADDIADSSALQGFLSSYVPAATQRTPTSLNGYVPNGLSEAEYKAQKKAEAAQKTQNKLKYPKGKAFVNVKDYLLDLAAKQKFKGDSYTSTGHAYVKTKYDWTGSKKAGEVDVIDPKINTIGAGSNKLMPPKMGAKAKKSSGGYSLKNPFSKFVLPAVSNMKHGNAVGTQDSMAFASGKDEEEKAVQKIVANDSNMPISLAAIGIGLLSLATMFGVRMQRGLQSASVLGSDMSVAMAPASGDNFLELETQGSAGQNSRSVGWGQMSSQNSSPLTPCYAFGSFGQKKAEPSTPARRPTSSGMSEMPSAALPWTTTTLTGELVGDVGFDPLGFSKYAPGAWWFGDEGDGSLKIFREAELMHGRIAQLACLGFVFPEIAHFPGNESVGQDAFGVMNPFLAVDAVPKAGWYQILAFMVSLEVLRLNRLKDPDYIPGDLGLGQGPGRWNPFGFEYTAEEYAEKQLQEIKHCRLAMLGFLGLASKASGNDIGILENLGYSFSRPEFVSKAGFYFPEGI